VAEVAAGDGLHGFPVTLTSFVGREEEIAALAGLLEHARLVTVAGPGGVGKTRLAAQVARRVAARFADGAWLAELTSVPDPGQAPAAVAAALDVPLAAGVPPADSLITSLARRQLLLVLDNCEHLLPALAGLCGAVLQAADDVRVLATSREPLGVSGESRYRLGPLRLPGSGDADLSGSEAVTLFADRARMSDPGFSLDSSSGPEVARLVARLDGMPLAIELAAARVEALGLTGLAELRGDGFGLLGGAGQQAADRHRTLAATAEWSYRLLGDQERRVFRMLSVLPGPFTLEAAQAVAGPGAERSVVRLVDCSLLVPPRAGVDGRARYLMLQTLRGYAAERLAADETELATAGAGLAVYAVGMAERAAAGMQDAAGELHAARSFDAEDTLVHQALSWALEHDRTVALRLAIALAPWWSLRGRQATGYRLLTDAAGHTAGRGVDWCTAQVWLGALARGIGEAARLEHYTAAAAALAGHPPSPLLIRALVDRAGCLANLGPAAEATDEAHAALVLARQIGDRTGEVRALRLLGLTANYRGDNEASLEWLRQALRVDPAAIPGSAQRECVSMLTLALLQSGELAEARHYGARALALARQAGALRDQANSLLLLAHIDLLERGHTDAAANLRQAIELSVRTGHGVLLIDSFDLCGHLCAQTQRPADALTAWAAYAACLQETGIADLPQYERWREEPQRKARQELGAARARSAERRGAAMGQVTAADYATLLVTAEPSARGQGAGLQRLSPRERELVTLVARGNTNTQIAGKLFISVRTVGSHLDRIRDKTGCRRRADLTRLALQTGLV
jgi:predicted ATPase/DNA-binding CsgD family transcriptional regulator